MRSIIFTLGLVLGLATLAAPLAGATAVSAGVSGQCYGANGAGGNEDWTRVTIDTAGATLINVHVLTVTGAVGALQQFATGTVGTPGEPPNVGNACGNEHAGHPDYLEADVVADGTFVQVCYDGESATVDPVPVLVATGTGPLPCPTAPNGP